MHITTQCQVVTSPNFIKPKTTLEQKKQNNFHCGQVTHVGMLGAGVWVNSFKFLLMLQLMLMS